MGKVALEEKILVTGVAGFIGSNLAKRLCMEVPSATVVGIDNINDYYDVALKEFRLKELMEYKNFVFVKGDIADKGIISALFHNTNSKVLLIWQHRLG